MRSRPSSSNSRFAGLMSRWTNPRRCAYSSPRAASSPSTRACDGFSSRPAVEHRTEAAAAEVLEHEVRPVVGEILVLAPVVDRHDVRMAERRRRSGLGTEALQEGGVTRQRGMQHLDRDLPPQLHVVGQVHLRGRAGADGSHEPVATTRARGRRGRPCARRPSGAHQARSARVEPTMRVHRQTVTAGFAPIAALSTTQR